MVLALTKKASVTSLKIDTICYFHTMKSAVELNRLILKFILLCSVEIQESSRKDNAKFKCLDVI